MIAHDPPHCRTCAWGADPAHTAQFQSPDGEVVILAGNYAEAGDWRFRMQVEGNPDAAVAELLPAMRSGLNRLREWRIRRAYVTPVVAEAGLYHHLVTNARARLAATPGADDDVIYLGNGQLR